MIAYNIPGVTAHVKLTGKLISEIYEGRSRRGTTRRSPPSTRA